MISCFFSIEVCCSIDFCSSFGVVGEICPIGVTEGCSVEIVGEVDFSSEIDEEVCCSVEIVEEFDCLMGVDCASNFNGCLVDGGFEFGRDCPGGARCDSC